MLKPGDKAPNFTAKDQNGKDVKLSDFKGKKVILFFYPADNTPTCTKEACNLRDNYAALKEAGYVVFGISADNEKSHRKFLNKYSLPYDLLVDTDKKIIEAYGVWGPKVLFGVHYEGILRTTFVINEKGILEKVIDKVISKDHAGQILASQV